MTERNTHELPLYIDPSFNGLAVEGIDLDQAKSAILLNADTEPILYGPNFSPTRIRYISGSRPKLEEIAAGLRRDTPRESAEAALSWVIDNIRHPFLSVPTPKNRAITEEEIIESGLGYCNEQTRVFIALCEVMGIPGRLCFLSHKNGKCGHATAEIYLDGKWAFFDITFGVNVELPDGKLGSAWELSRTYRDLASKAYRPELERCEPLYIPSIESEPGWRTGERVTPDAGGDLMHTIGICNYIIDGVEVV
jgi:transglutaminase-like putative cysteine protease